MKDFSDSDAITEGMRLKNRPTCEISATPGHNIRILKNKIKIKS